MVDYLTSLQRYIDFTDEDRRRLRQLLGPAQPYFHGFSEHFYQRIAAHPDAHRVIEGPEQEQRLKQTLREWMRTGLAGPHDQAFYKRRSRIGRVHVRIGLPQHFMFTAMNVMRLDYHHMIAELYGDDRQLERDTCDSVDKLFDLELAIMLRTYQQDSEERMRRSERLATIGQVAGSIGHDLRNPLSVMQSSLYILSRKLGEDPRTHHHLDRIRGQVEVCSDIIGNLLQLVRNRPPRREPVDFQHMVERALSTMTVPRHIDIESSLEAGLTMNADTSLLAQALSNLVDNAIKAYGPDSGTVYIIVRSDDDRHIVVEVADEGPGFSPEAITRVFEPLVTMRDSGTGLGLALVKGITERHGGTVEAINRPHGGAAVRLRLPRHEGAANDGERSGLWDDVDGETDNGGGRHGDGDGSGDGGGNGDGDGRWHGNRDGGWHGDGDITKDSGVESAMGDSRDGAGDGDEAGPGIAPPKARAGQRGTLRGTVGAGVASKVEATIDE